MRAFDRCDRFSANIGEMMERLGIDADADIEEQFGRTLDSVVRSCQRCRFVATCNDWLARAPVAVPSAPAFCPYAERLENLALDQAVIPRRSHTVH